MSGLSLLYDRQTNPSIVPPMRESPRDGILRCLPATLGRKPGIAPCRMPAATDVVGP